jgi:hypothetical protein
VNGLDNALLEQKGLSVRPSSYILSGLVVVSFDAIFGGYFFNMMGFSVSIVINAA